MMHNSSQVATKNSKVEIVSNFFKFKLGSKNANFFKYALHIKPEVPDDAKLRMDIYNAAKKQIFSILGPNVFSQTAIYAVESVSDIDIITIDHKGTEYKLYIEWVTPIEFESFEGAILLRRFLANLIRKRKLINIKRNYFDPSKKIMMQNSGFEVWPGYSTTVNLYGKNLLIGLNLTYRVLRTETALDKLKKLKNSCTDGKDFNELVNEEFKGLVVLTRYNGDKSYYIDGVDLDKTLDFKFEIKNKQNEKSEVTIKEYYETRYKIQFTDLNQPLLINKSMRTGGIIYLVPELCILTGLTDENRANTNLMKELSNVTKGSAVSKVKDIKSFMEGIINLKEYQAESERWGIYLDENPLQFSSTKLAPGRILMSMQNNNTRHSFDIETANFDREIQHEMYAQPSLKKWLIFVGQRDGQHAETCMNTFKQVSDTFRYSMNKPDVITVKSNQPRDWVSTIESSIGPDVQMVLCICPGQKGKAPMYSELEYLLTTKYPVP